MKLGGIIPLKSGLEEELNIIEWAEESGLAGRVKKLNDERCRIVGISSPQSQPLPGPLESWRAFFLRVEKRIKGGRKNGESKDYKEK